MSNATTNLLDMFTEVEAEHATVSPATWIKINDERCPKPEAQIKAERQAMKVRSCGNCQGTGYIECYRHICNGVCFACGGFGK